MKAWYTSKTIWVNVIALIGSVVTAKFGYTIDPQYQVYGLTLINLALRKITSSEITW